jgi:hypothetical protein
MNVIQVREKDNEVAKRIKEMMLENTGAHPLDSGDYYGRGYEIRKEWNWSTIPLVDTNLDEYGLNPVINAYPYLVASLDITPESEVLDQRLKEEIDNSNEDFLTIMERVGQDLEKEKGFLASTVNTYNFDSLLDLVLQAVILYDDSIPYLVLLQTHNGCDVRGGYSTPRAFAVVNEMFLLDLNMDSLDVGCRCGVQNLTEKAKDIEFRRNKKGKIVKTICKKCKKELIITHNLDYS